MSDKRLYHTVAQQIIKLIKDGDFPPGSRLPGERDLAEKLNVSRVTVREAEIALEAKGLLDIRTGSGVYVLNPDAGTSQYLPDVSAFELTEARSLIESEAAALAATTITDEELDRLDSIVRDMEAEQSPHGALEHDSDHDFHMTIAKATKNQAMVDMIERLWLIRAEIPRIKLSYDSICGLDPAGRLEEHREIAVALRARDPSRARQAMRKHFICIIEALLKATEKREMEELKRKANESRERYLLNNERLSS
ncbi:FadR family transcriptional regulator [Alteromonadaceae bacterium M269]|nr:FadR family transcriptional regulator [Alteromonadaceae bacterium M269]